jgi:mRNA interferase RelE/StbE
MPYEIILAPEAIDDLRNLRADMRSRVRHAIDNYLRYEPTKTSKSRIKRLRELIKPQYCLRVEELRIFNDVVEEAVEIIEWLMVA